MTFCGRSVCSGSFSSTVTSFFFGALTARRCAAFEGLAVGFAGRGAGTAGTTGGASLAAGVGVAVGAGPTALDGRAGDRSRKSALTTARITIAAVATIHGVSERGSA